VKEFVLQQKFETILVDAFKSTKHLNMLNAGKIIHVDQDIQFLAKKINLYERSTEVDLSSEQMKAI
jgi:hypothetical protein